MQKLYKERVVEFVEFYNKPFRSEHISLATGIPDIPARKVINYLIHRDYLKIVGFEGNWKIYAKNEEFKGFDSKENEYHYRYRIMKNIIRVLRAGNYATIYHISLSVEMSKQAVRRYIEALASAGMVSFKDGYYCYTGKEAYNDVGKNVEKRIITKLKAKDKKKKSSKNYLEIKKK